MRQLVLVAILICSTLGYSQIQARFTMPKKSFVAGEPIFLEYTVRNTGNESVFILAATPNTLCSGYEVQVEGIDHALPKRCDGLIAIDCLSSGSTLKPGTEQVERYLVNGERQNLQPGRYRIRAHRALPTSADADLSHLGQGPKIDTFAEFEIEITKPDEAALRRILLPYFSNVESNYESALVVRSLASPAVEDEVLRLREHPHFGYVTVAALAAVDTEATRKQLAEIATGSGEFTYEAASALGRSGDRSYFPVLQKLALSQPVGRRSMFVAAAAELGGDEAVVWIGELLRSSRITSADTMNPLVQTASRRAVPILIDMIADPSPEIQTSAQSALVNLTHHAFNPKQIVPEDTPAAHAAWLRWWSRNEASAPIYKLGEYCGNAAPLE